MGIFTREPLDWTRARLKAFMPDVFSVEYYSAFPRADGTTFSWFQVVFVVGPGEDAAVRDQVHGLFEQVLPIIARLRVVREADLVSLRARRRMLGEPPFGPDNPIMFIEAGWPGAALARMRRRGDFSVWAGECMQYVNRFDASDAFTKMWSGR